MSEESNDAIEGIERGWVRGKRGGEKRDGGGESGKRRDEWCDKA